MKKSSAFTIAAAQLVQDAKPEDERETSGVCGFPFPSVEAFMDEWLENIVGFSSTYPDPKRVETWINSCQFRMAEEMGPEAVVLAELLMDEMFLVDDECYKEAVEIHGEATAWEHAECVTGDPEWFTELCDIVRSYIDGDHS